jgi:N-acyl-D-aspartate/D-glutamate deacylase
MAYDLKLTGGTIVDGTGAPRYVGDVAIAAGKVVALGNVAEEADRTIDATGRIVSPGFVDIHTHYDAQIMWDNLVSCSPWHGVTTVVMGNCGFSVAPTRPEHRDLIMRTLENVEGMSVDALRAGLGDDWGFESFPEYLDAVDDRGCAVNVAALIGHTALRMYVLGEESVSRDATPEEIAAQRDLLREALEAGALGFATSKASTHVGYDGNPVPSRMADPEEIFTIAQALGEVPNAVMQATVGRGLTHDEFARIAESTGKNVSWTALLSGVPKQDYREELRRAAEIQARGLPVYPQVAVQPVQFEMSWKAPFIYESLRCFQPVAKSDLEGRKAHYADPDWRETFKEKAGNGGIIGDRWARTTISWYPTEPGLEGRNVQELADDKGQDPVDVMMDLALDADLDMRITQDVINYDRDDIQVLLSDPTTVIGLSDAGAHASQLCDAKYSTEFLSTFVREREAFTLEQGVHMLTQRPAQVFGITDRGTLEVGKPADVVVFDAAEVGHLGKRRVNDLPAGADRIISDAKGIDAVIVNGTVIRRDGVDQVEPGPGLPGQLLRNGRA